MIPGHDNSYIFTDALAPRIPESVEISSITPTSATVQFTLTDPFDVTHPEGFVVMYGLISGQLNSNSSVITATSSSQTYSITLTSLQIGTQYFYRVIATNQFATRMTVEMMFLTEDTSKTDYFFHLEFLKLYFFCLMLPIFIDFFFPCPKQLNLG